MPNKVNFGLENVYYAKATDDGTGTLTYGTPVAIKGAVDLNLDQLGEISPWYADNCVFFTSTSNNGYQGTLEVANLPESFYTDIFGEQADTAGAIYEKADVEPAEFALLYEVRGDAEKVRRCFYRCTAQRPAATAHTTEANTTPTTVTLNITAMPVISNKVVKARCKESDSCYANWFTAVHVIA